MKRWIKLGETLVGKTYKRDSDKFDRNRNKTYSRRASIRYEQYDPEEDQEENYERIRSKARSTISKQIEKDS